MRLPTRSGGAARAHAAPIAVRFESAKPGCWESSRACLQEITSDSSRPTGNVRPHPHCVAGEVLGLSTLKILNRILWFVQAVQCLDPAREHSGCRKGSTGAHGDGHRSRDWGLTWQSLLPPAGYKRAGSITATAGGNLVMATGTALLYGDSAGGRLGCIAGISDR